MSVWGTPVVSGGGGVTILSGTGTPAAAQGKNGQICLRYDDALPSGITGLEYIQSVSGRYIDTGYIPKENSQFVLEADISSTNPEWSTPFGVQRGGVWTGYFITVKYNGNPILGYGWNTGVTSVGNMSAFYGKRVELTLSSSLAGIRDEEGNTVSAAVSQAWGTLNSPIFLFVMSQDGSVGANTNWCSMKLYRFTILEDGVVVRRFVPVLDQNDTPCLYETVTGAYFHNQGTGDFTAGPSLEERPVTAAYVKKSGVWRPLVGTSIGDIDLGT